MELTAKAALRTALMITLPVLVTAPAVAGSVLTMQSRDLSENPAELSSVSIYSEGDAMRMDTAGSSADDSSSVIFDSSASVMTTIDHDAREYFVLDEATVQGIAGQMTDVMQQMQDALKDLPPEQRAMAEQMMKQRMGSMTQSAPAAERVKLQKTGKSDSVNGYDCDIYELIEAGQKRQDMCVTDWSNVEGGRDFQQNVKKMSAFFNDLRQAYEESGFNLGSTGDAMSYLDEVDGFPARVREYDGGSVTNETTLVSSESQSIDSAMFSAPDGYTQQSLQR